MISVLYVDDEPSLLEICRTLIRTRGVRVDTCESAKEALVRLSHTAYDAIISGLPDAFC